MLPKLPNADAKILIVDDDESISLMTETVLRIEGYTCIHSLNDPRGVLTSFIEFEPDLVILDLMMPHLDGFQLLQCIHNTWKQATPVPILVVSSLGAGDERYRALAEGAIDVFCKPFEPKELLFRIQNLLRLRMAYREIEIEREKLSREAEEFHSTLQKTYIEVVERLAHAAECRDDDTGEHTQRVALTSSLLARALGLPPEKAEELLRSAPLHDVGKIGVPDCILLKPDKLTAAEFAVMKNHCTLGASMLSSGRSDIVQNAERIALTHHEKWDGSGYPNGLKGEEICLEGRILAVADVFDALTHARPYKDAWPVEKAVSEICSLSGQHFDPHVVQAFMTLPHHKLL